MQFEFSDLDILIISPEPWSHLFVSKHHYAKKLAEKGNKVVFLNPPSSEFGMAATDYDNLSITDYKGFVPGFRFFPKVIRKRILRKVFQKIEDMSQCQFDLVWSFDNSVFFDLDALPDNVLTISHIVDKGQDFQFERACRSATICLGVIPEIVDRQKLLNPKSYLIRHGVDILPGPTDEIHMPGSNKHKALYFGNLGMEALDWELMSKAAQRFNEVDFVLIGSNAEKAPIESGLINIFLLDAVGSHQLRSYMAAADILFLFYDSTYMQKFASPHKLMEYFSSGKPIVSPYFEEYRPYSHLITMSATRDEWLTNFELTIDNLATESEEGPSTQRKKLAAENTYLRQLEKIEKLLASV